MAVTVIGRMSRVQGRVSGEGDLEVVGFVEGDVAIDGDVRVEAEGLVSAGIRARRIVVRGSVRGDLIAQEAIILEDGARVVGDIQAPRVAIGEGALARGNIQAGEEQAAPAPGRAQAAARTATTSLRVAQSPLRAGIALGTASSRVATKTDAATAGMNSQGAGLLGNAGSGARRPPPPVVPALKKAKGQLVKKKDR